MVKVLGLNVPSWATELYNRIIKPNSLLLLDTLRLNYATVSREKKVQLKNSSYFVLWEPLWATFNQTRKDNWTDYWGTLPFGLHTGVGNWPGSGYSAFIYVNAPRFKAGQDLLLDPPTFDGGLITNGQFKDGFDFWNYDTDIWVTLEYLELYGEIMGWPADNWDSYGDPLYLGQNLDLTTNDYRLEFDVNIPIGYEGFDTGLIIDLGGSDGIQVGNTAGVGEHISIDILASEQEEGWPFFNRIRFIPYGMPADIESLHVGSPILIDNISLKIIV